jgi:hypothetical protein
MRTLSKLIVTYLIEYLGKFEFIFETILDYESGDQMGSFDAKKQPSKISRLGTFKRLTCSFWSPMASARRSLMRLSVRWSSTFLCLQVNYFLKLLQILLKGTGILL